MHLLFPILLPIYVYQEQSTSQRTPSLHSLPPSHPTFPYRGIIKNPKPKRHIAKTMKRVHISSIKKTLQKGYLTYANQKVSDIRQPKKFSSAQNTAPPRTANHSPSHGKSCGSILVHVKYGSPPSLKSSSRKFRMSGLAVSLALTLISSMRRSNLFKFSRL
jgi:hypothetical protein